MSRRHNVTARCGLVLPTRARPAWRALCIGARCPYGKGTGWPPSDQSADPLFTVIVALIDGGSAGTWKKRTEHQRCGRATGRGRRNP